MTDFEKDLIKDVVAVTKIAKPHVARIIAEFAGTESAARLGIVMEVVAGIPENDLGEFRKAINAMIEARPAAFAMHERKRSGRPLS